MNGETVYIDGEPVDNVLVEPGLSNDAEDIKRPVGARVDYTLRFPIGSVIPAHGAKAAVRGASLDVLNVPDHWRPQDVFFAWSNPWDMTVLVGRSLGDFTRTVSIVSIAATVDALGDPVASEEAVYEGAAQARMDSGAESPGDSSVTDSEETWFFVVPWDEAFRPLRPQSTYILCDGARYDVQSVEDVDGKGEHASFKAVRRG